MRATLFLALIALLFIGQVVAQTSVSASPSAASASSSEVDCIPDDDSGPNEDIIIIIQSSTGLYDCSSGYGGCPTGTNDVDGGITTPVTAKPKCSKSLGGSYYYGGSTWSGLNMTQLIIVCVLVGVFGLVSIVAITRAVIRTRKAAAVAADEKAQPVIEVVTDKVIAA